MNSFNKSCINTPEVLKSFSRPVSNSRSKQHLPPGSSSLVKGSLFDLNEPVSGYQIIVFGFKEQDKDKVIQKLQKFGIIDVAADIGPHILGVRFRDPRAAAQACCLNGQVILENTMIGVKPSETQAKSNKSSSKYLNEDDSFCVPIKKKVRRKFGLWCKVKYYFFNLDPDF